MIYKILAGGVWTIIETGGGGEVDLSEYFDDTQTYRGLKDKNGNGWIRTPSSGLLPSVANTGAIGSNGWNFDAIYGRTIFENNVPLANKYLNTNSFKEAYMGWGGTNHVGTYSPIDGAMVSELGANRLAFTPASKITIEYSRDGGTSWFDYSSEDNAKINLFNGIGSNHSIGKNNAIGVNYTNYQLRVTLNTDGAVYTNLNKFVILISSYGSVDPWVTIDARFQSNYVSNINSWNTITNKQTIGGWSGYNVINTPNITTYGNTPDTQYGQVRFTFGCTGYSNDFPGLLVTKIMGFGGVGWVSPSHLAQTGHLYSYDAYQNALFPAGVFSNGVKTILEGDARLTNSRVASDVYAWAKQPNKPSYSLTDLTDVEFGGNPQDGDVLTYIGNGRWDTTSKPSYSYSELTDKPTTLSGYGITDSYTKSEVLNRVGSKLDLSGGIMTGKLDMNSNEVGNIGSLEGINNIVSGLTIDSVKFVSNIALHSGYHIYKDTNDLSIVLAAGKKLFVESGSVVSRVMIANNFSVSGTTLTITTT